jgi:hypothetical protein
MIKISNRVSSIASAPRIKKKTSQKRRQPKGQPKKSKNKKQSGEEFSEAKTPKTEEAPKHIDVRV